MSDSNNPNDLKTEIANFLYLFTYYALSRGIVFSIIEFVFNIILLKAALINNNVCRIARKYQYQYRLISKHLYD